MTDVDVAVGVRRAIVQDEFVASGTGFTDLLVETVLFPTGQQIRLAFGQISAHREIGIRQIQRRLVLAFHFIVHSSYLSLKAERIRTGCKVGLCRLLVRCDGVPQLINMVKFFLITDFVQQLHVQVLTVEVTTEAEQVHFQ